MTSERIKGQITFTCDEGTCHEFLEADSRDFTTAVAEMYAAGWTAKKLGDEWFHFCKDHHPKLDMKKLGVT